MVPLLQLGLSSGFLDQVWSTRLGRGYQEGLRLIAQVEKELWQARFMAPMLAAGTDQQTAMERAAQRAADINSTPVLDRALLAAYRRQQELAWTEQLVEDIEPRWKTPACSGGPSGSRRCASWTWWATPADRGAGRPGRRRTGRQAGRAGRPVLA